MNSTAIGMIQCQTLPVPEVGSQPRLTAKTRMPTMAIQKSGAEAPTSEMKVAIRSKTPPGPERRERADDDGGDGDERHGDDGERQRPDEGLEHDVDRRAGLAQGLSPKSRWARSPDVAGRTARSAGR